MSAAPFDTVAMTAELISCEDVRLLVYDDATGLPIGPGDTLIGHPTIGIGRALDVDGLTRPEVAMLGANDIAKYRYELGTEPWFATLDGVRQRAIVNMRHQLGLDGVLGFHDMIAALMRHDYAAAAAAGLQSQWAVETPERAARVMAQLRSGTALGAASVA